MTIIKGSKGEHPIKSGSYIWAINELLRESNIPLPINSIARERINSSHLMAELGEEQKDRFYDWGDEFGTSSGVAYIGDSIKFFRETHELYYPRQGHIRQDGSIEISRDQFERIDSQAYSRKDVEALVGVHSDDENPLMAEIWSNLLGEVRFKTYFDSVRGFYNLPGKIMAVCLPNDFDENSVKIRPIVLGSMKKGSPLKVIGLNSETTLVGMLE